MKYLILCLLFLTGCSYPKFASSEPQCDKVTLRVVRIGGCDRMGYCGAILSNNKKYELNHPVEGELVEVCK